MALWSSNEWPPVATMWLFVWGGGGSGGYEEGEGVEGASTLQLILFTPAAGAAVNL